MWDALHDIAVHHKIGLDEMVTRIDRERDPRDNLTAAIRVYIVEFYRDQWQPLTLISGAPPIC